MRKLSNIEKGHYEHFTIVVIVARRLLKCNLERGHTTDLPSGKPLPIRTEPSRNSRLAGRVELQCSLRHLWAEDGDLGKAHLLSSSQ